MTWALLGLGIVAIASTAVTATLAIQHRRQLQRYQGWVEWGQQAADEVTSHEV